MKGIFKQTGLAIPLVLSVFTAQADEGEIYKTELTNREPQVLIILDTSKHMNSVSDYPYPPIYDPSISYPPTPQTFGGRFAQNLINAEYVYYNNNAGISEINHTALTGIAQQQLALFEAGQQVTIDPRYNNFVATIPSWKSKEAFNAEEMNCYSALNYLDGELGAFSDTVKQRWDQDSVLLPFFKFSWRELKIWDGFSNLITNHVECETDIVNNEGRNPGYEHKDNEDGEDIDGTLDGYNEVASRQGFPNLVKSYAWEDAYQKNAKNSLVDSEDPNKYKTYLYSENLVKWADLKKNDDVDANGNFELANLQIAKKVVLDLMLKSKDIKIGLEVFNANATRFEWLDAANNHGGRILSGIQTYEDVDKVNALKKKVKQILTSNVNKSALCESLYEGYLYLYGKEMEFGDNRLLSRPLRDRSVEETKAGKTKYKDPLIAWQDTCQNEAYVIIISRGYHDVSQSAFDWMPCRGPIDDHDHDDKANAAIKALPGVDTSKAEQVNSADCNNNYLPVLSDWLANNDINADPEDGVQRIVTYTVGIGDLPAGNRRLLEKTAEYGDGEFYKATNANELRTELETAFADIIARQQAVASAISTSVNSTNATQSNEFVYYSMFLPNPTSRWQGNLRKFKVTNDGILSAWTEAASAGTGTTVATVPALAAGDDSFFNDELYSGWSSESGLSEVSRGGVAAALRERRTPRNIYITDANDSELLALNKDNLKSAFTVSTDAELAIALGISTDKLSSAINWLQGRNEANEYRNDIFGDPMHSVPLVVEFPDNESADIKAKARIFIGTNAGFFHAFKDNGRAVEEEWAFIPKENIVNALKLNYQVTKAEERIYGIDSSAVDASYIDSHGVSQHMITFGMRRGGERYYSLNVSIGSTLANTTVPELNWVIANDADAQVPAYPQLAQTWSIPVVTKIFRGDEDSNAKPVLIFGGGYDSSKDHCGSNNVSVKCSDSTGRAIYIVDADSGDVLKSFTNGDISDSIASQLAVLDSDGDGYADRIYAPDTSGNIYRVDMPRVLDIRTNEFTMDTSKWRLFKLAALGGSHGNDRRFFNPPSIVRAKDSDGSAYDGLLLGSGDITSPNSNLLADNYFFNIKDNNVFPQVWGDSVGEKPAPEAIQFKNLSKISYNSLNGGENYTPVTGENSLHGWRYALNQFSEKPSGAKSFGQKSLGVAVVINGVVHFNSYSPYSKDYVAKNGQCIVDQSGNSHYYQLDLNVGSTKTYKRLPNTIAKDLAVHAAVNAAGEPVLRLLGAGKGESKTDADGVTTPTGTIDTKVTLTPRPIYRFMDEQ